MRAPLSAATAVVHCAGAAHRLSWQDGTLTALDHPEPDRERALTALGGEAYRCLQLLDVWERHVDDLDVLLLASRGAGDRVERDRDDEHNHPHHHGRRHRSSGWYAYNQVGMQSYAPLSAMGSDNRNLLPALQDLLRLEGRLADRLAAQVIDHWTGLIENGDGEAEAARSRLQAALYGRVVATVRDWLGEPALRVDLEVIASGAPRSIRRVDGAIAVTLPFAWLAEVWSPGLAVVADRLVLTAESPRPGRVELVALDAGLVEHCVTIEDLPENV